LTRSGTRTWALITGEYPPQLGGVADYTRSVAASLAADGDDVRVFAPLAGASDIVESGISVQRLPDHFGSRSRRLLQRALAELPHPRAAVVQYVPQAFGMRGCNIPFARWLRTLCGYPLFIMFHEVSVTVRPSTPLKYRLQALATRAMAVSATVAADAIFISTPAWEPLVRRGARERTPIDWVPTPSNIALRSEPAAALAAREQFRQANVVLGHFGTYREEFTRRQLADILQRVLTPGRMMLFMGRGSQDFAQAMRRRFPHLSAQIAATGGLSPQGLADALSACDLVVQPFEDGVSARRGSVIGALALGVPIATTNGTTTESLWSESRAVGLVPSGSSAALSGLVDRLAEDRAEREQLGNAARALYTEHFSIEHTTRALRQRLA
jgi:glycosyltransferase involved in cell wall biosynthesis